VIPFVIIGAQNDFPAAVVVFWQTAIDARSMN